MDKRTLKRAIKYCLRDARITYKTAKFLHETYSQYGLTPKSTLPATALAIWKTRFWKREIELPADEIVELAREAYFGGRTEAFSLGEYSNVSVIDVASMYPWAMVAGDMPLPWGDFERVRRNDKILPNGIYRASCESEIPIPVLPVKVDGRLVFPNGRFEGTFVGEEIQYAVSIGVRVNVHSGIVFSDSCRPFDDYVSSFFAAKNAARGAERVMYKLLLTSLYGKYGQRGEHTECMRVEDFRDLKEPPEDFRMWNGLVLFEESGEIPPWGNVVWSAIITARGRIRLHKEINRLLQKGARPLYCDTDSIMYLANRARVRYPKRVREAGLFEARGTYRKLLIVGKKEYGLQGNDGKWEFQCKGVPWGAREDYIRTGKATYVKPTKLKESTRTKHSANVWKSVTKTRRVSFAGREHRPDGSLAPVAIRDGVLIESGKIKGGTNGKESGRKGARSQASHTGKGRRTEVGKG